MPRPRLIFADPPYNQGIDYGAGTKADKMPVNEYRRWVKTWVNRAADILTPDGSLWVLMPHEHQAIAFLAMESAGLNWRNTITWVESFGTYCHKKFGRTSRVIHYFTKSKKDFVFNADSVRVASLRLAHGDKRADPRGKIMDDVWTGISRLCGTFNERIEGFPTQLPLLLLERIVQVASEPGDLVLDPFCGSGTTGAAALGLGRRFIGIEKNEDYCKKASKRLIRTELV